MAYLLDTNVVSELRRRAPAPAVVHWFDQTDGSLLYLSVLVVGELEQGIARLERRDPPAAAALAGWLDELRRRYASRILTVDAAVATAWGRLNAVRPLPAIDGLLAATARVHGLTLVTRDAGALAGLDVPVLDPFAIA